MSAAQVNVNRDNFGLVYMWSLVIAGAAIVLGSIYELPLGNLDAGFVFLCLMVMASSLVAIRIPRVSGRITVADTFVFLTMLLYGGAAAILVSALEGVAATLIISKRPRTILFNSARPSSRRTASGNGLSRAQVARNVSIAFVFHLE